MDTLDDQYCVDCQLDQLDPPQPVEYFKYGPQCGRHYRRSHNTRPKCKTEGCAARLNTVDRKTRNCHCRKCERTCLQQKRAATIQSALDRIGNNIVPRWDTSCWLWTGKVTKGTTIEKTYGLINVGTKSGKCGGSGKKDEWRVHRFMLVNFFGPHKHGEEVDHLCGTSLCVNPVHVKAWPPWRHHEWTKLRKAAPERPWHLHSNQLNLTLPLIVFAFKYGLPIRPGDCEWNDGVQELDGTYRPLIP